MKKIIVFMLFLTTITSFAGVEDILRKPAVDKRVELMSIVFRLAGKEEYIDRSFKLYTDRIDKHFERYKNHELITFTKSIMYDCGIGYDAVIVMGLSLDDKLNLVNEGTLDDRWKKEHRYKFVKLLKKFYKDSRFDEFYKSNKDIYEESAKRFLPIYEAVDLNWYTKFYGKKPTEEFIIINGLGTGGCSYGPSFEYKKGKKSVYAIVGTWSVDSLGVPLYNCDQFLPVLLHEFNHSFVNNLTENNRELFRSSGQQLFSLVEEPMRAQAYGSWTTVLNEALVRAAVIKYMKDHDYGDYAIERAIRYEIGLCFSWIRELISDLEIYDNQREIYPTLESYIPVIAQKYKGYFEVAKNIEMRKPKVLSIDEFINGDKDVSANIETITFNFDIPLSGRGCSVNSRRGKIGIPKIESTTYTNDNKTVILKVKLERDKEYLFTITGESFESEDGLGIRNYELFFKTKE